VEDREKEGEGVKLLPLPFPYPPHVFKKMIAIHSCVSFTVVSALQYCVQLYAC